MQNAPMSLPPPLKRGNTRGFELGWAGFSKEGNGFPSHADAKEGFLAPLGMTWRCARNDMGLRSE